MKYIYLAIAILMLGSCTKYAQVLETETSSSNIRKDRNFHVYENDTLKVVYNFWAESGVMSFMLYNKLNRPIYIDWKKSSFISLGKKKDYYVDMISKKSISSTTSFISNYYFPIIQTFGVGAETEVKEERVTFIPPKSYILRHSAIIANTFIDANFSKEKIKAGSDMYHPAFILYTAKVNESDPLIFFRNFITYSTSESFNQENYLDNEFHVSKVMVLPEKRFRWFTIEPKHKVVYYYYYQTPTGFYVMNIKKKMLSLN